LHAIIIAFNGLKTAAYSRRSHDCRQTWPSKTRQRRYPAIPLKVLPDVWGISLLN